MKTIVSKMPIGEGFLFGKDSTKIGYPWLTYGAVIALERLVNKDMKVLEFGSGGSTIFWSKHCKSVISFETDPVWYKKVKKLTKDSNVDLILGDQEQILESVAKLPDNSFDMVLVDSAPSKNRRWLFANAAAKKLKMGGYLIADNYGRFSMNGFDYSKWDVYTFDELNGKFAYQGRGTKICRKIQEI